MKTNERESQTDPFSFRRFSEPTAQNIKDFLNLELRTGPIEFEVLVNGVPRTFVADFSDPLSKIFSVILKAQ
jgi:hypothetical protein